MTSGQKDSMLPSHISPLLPQNWFSDISLGEFSWIWKHKHTGLPPRPRWEWWGQHAGQECHEKTTDVLHDVPEEVCDLTPRKVCRPVTRLVPSLQPSKQCTSVPRVTCLMVLGEPRLVNTPLKTEWCLQPEEDMEDIQARDNTRGHGDRLGFTQGIVKFRQWTSRQKQIFYPNVVVCGYCGNKVVLGKCFCIKIRDKCRYYPESQARSCWLYWWRTIIQFEVCMSGVRVSSLKLLFAELIFNRLNRQQDWEKQTRRHCLPPSQWMRMKFNGVAPDFTVQILNSFGS